jgi:hypothetical protein
MKVLLIGSERLKNEKSPSRIPDNLKNPDFGVDSGVEMGNAGVFCFPVSAGEF